MVAMLQGNSNEPIRTADLIKNSRGEPSRIWAGNWENKGGQIVDIIAYALMPNHFHIIVREKTLGGISKMMLKILTAYSMYFNKKYERSGPLFTRPFRARHVGSDEYFMWLFSYVTLNPIDLVEANWRVHGLQNTKAARAFMRNYRYSTFHDYFVGARPESALVASDAKRFAPDVHTFDDLLDLLARNEGEALVY